MIMKFVLLCEQKRADGRCHGPGRSVTSVSPSQVGVAWTPANDGNPVVQDFVRCCLDNKPSA